MRSRILQCAAAITLFVALAVPAQLVAQSNYSVVELGERGGTAGSADGINNRGWITGTDNLAVMGSQMPQTMSNAPMMGSAQAHGGQPAPAMPTNPDYGHLGTPSVWRHRQHAAAKVEALSSHGMDEIEIPAFLRKQAD